MVIAKKLSSEPFSGNYARVQTAGDGSCFFHSLAALMNYQLYWECESDEEIVERGLRLRARLMNEKYYNEFCELRGEGIEAPSFESVVMRETYADDFIYSYISWVLNINICFIFSNDNGWKKDMHQCNPDSNIVMFMSYYHEIEHFEPIVKISNDDHISMNQIKSLESKLSETNLLKPKLTTWNAFITPYKSIFNKNSEIFRAFVNNEED